MKLMEYGMQYRKLLFVAVLLSLGACGGEPTTPAANSPYYRPPTPAEQACVSRGFLRGTNEYDDCLARESGGAKPLPPPVQDPQTGVEVFRDEFGFRYDGRGNRLDAKGNIISPRSTTP